MRGEGNVEATRLDLACCVLFAQVPKAFKIIPNLVNWEEVLQLTDPENWSPHAM